MLLGVTYNGGRCRPTDSDVPQPAGPDTPDRATRLHLLGTRAAAIMIGSGLNRGRRCGADQSGMEQVGGRDSDCCEPSQDSDGPGPAVPLPGPRCGILGKCRYLRSRHMIRWDLSRFETAGILFADSSLRMEMKRVSNILVSMMRFPTMLKRLHPRRFRVCYTHAAWRVLVSTRVRPPVFKLTGAALLHSASASAT